VQFIVDWIIFYAEIVICECFLASTAAWLWWHDFVLFGLLFDRKGRGKTVNVFICNQTVLDLTASATLLIQMVAIVAGVTNIKSGLVTFSDMKMMNMIPCCMDGRKSAIDRR